MITIHSKNCKPISQTFYDNTIFSIDLSLVTCTCGHTGCLIWYGNYMRKVKEKDHTISLRVARVFCNLCRHTHALLLSNMVPYSQFTLNLYIDVIERQVSGKGYKDLLDENPCADENTFSYMIRSYKKHWKERLISFQISLSPHLSLITSCFSLFSRQFMQIKNTRNKLYLSPT